MLYRIYHTQVLVFLERPRPPMACNAVKDLGIDTKRIALPWAR